MAMTVQGWAEIVLAIGLAVGLAWPIGAHIARVWSGEPTFLTPVLGPVEGLIFRLSGVDPDQSQNWLQYALSLLAFSGAGFLSLYAILRLQGFLPLNPQHIAGMAPDLAFNVAIGFVANTDWQSYVPETGVSHLSRLAGLTTQNFTSAASGLSVASALTRAFAARGRTTIGNFWEDLVRNALYVLLPMAAVVALILLGLGVPQTLVGHVNAHGLEGAIQTFAVGPVASQEAIKLLGTNGGGFFAANSSHPFENPSGITNMIEMAAMGATGFACAIAFGRVTHADSDARALIFVMALMVAAAAAAIYVAESQPTPALAAAGVQNAPNLEGKELRFGAADSAAFAAMTTGTSTGAVNSMHESFTPAGGGVALFLILLGQTLPGGVGSGLCGMLVMALLAVLIAGLLVGRTPEYLGKKIGDREIKLAMMSLLIVSFTTLGFSAIAASLPSALTALSTGGPHGLTELLYAYGSATANNGSAFAGIRGQTPFWNTTIGVAMAMGKFGVMMPVLAIAGGLAAKPKLRPSEGSFPTDGPLFVGLVTAIILILAGLQYFPALALGPIIEHFQMVSGQ